MKGQVVLVILLLVQSTQVDGDMAFEQPSCSTLEPIDAGTKIDKNIMKVKFEPPTLQLGSPIILTISSTEGKFSNAFLRTICDSCSNKNDRIGQFARSDTALKFIDCDGHNASAARGRLYTNKDLFTMKWVPDPDVAEQFHFEGAMVLNVTHWYSGYKSDIFTITSSARAALRTDAVLLCIVITAMIFH